MSSCYKTSNNKYTNCPPRMDDGRHFTDYRPRCLLNNITRLNNNIRNSFEYRLFLSRNAEKLMQENRQKMCDKYCCDNCDVPSTMLPEESIVKCNKFTCYASKLDNNGLGQGRDYGKECI